MTYLCLYLYLSEMILEHRNYCNNYYNPKPIRYTLDNDRRPLHMIFPPGGLYTKWPD